MTEFVGLLRGINVGGHNRIAMADLRRICEDLGWADVRTYIQSGNLVFRASGTAARLEAELEKAIERERGMSIAVLARSAAEWRKCLAANPFPAESEAEPNRVLLCLSKRPPPQDAGTKIEAKGRSGERAAVAGGAIWIHYPAGVGQSKIPAILLDRLTDSPVTARNWRTALELDRMARAFEGP